MPLREPRGIRRGVEVIATGVRPAPNSASRVLTYDKSSDEAVWEGKTVKRSDPIPQ